MRIFKTSLENVFGRCS